MHRLMSITRTERVLQVPYRKAAASRCAAYGAGKFRYHQGGCFPVGSAADAGWDLEKLDSKNCFTEWATAWGKRKKVVVSCGD